MNCQASNEHIIRNLAQYRWAPVFTSNQLKKMIDQLQRDMTNGIMVSVRNEPTRNIHKDMEADSKALKCFQNQLLGSWK